MLAICSVVFSTFPTWAVEQLRRYYDKVRVLLFVYVPRAYKTNECVCSDGGGDLLKKFLLAREDAELMNFWKDTSKVSKFCGRCLSTLPATGLYAEPTHIFLLSPTLAGSRVLDVPDHEKSVPGSCKY